MTLEQQIERLAHNVQNVIISHGQAARITGGSLATTGRLIEFDIEPPLPEHQLRPIFRALIVAAPSLAWQLSPDRITATATGQHGLPFVALEPRYS